MKKKMLALLLISSLLSATVMAADTTAADAIDAETRIVTVNAETLETTTDSAEENIIEITETKYIDESGFSLWYNAESLKTAQYGGQLCFVPAAEEDTLKSPAVLIIVPNEAGDTPSPLNEVTAMYPAESISEIEETTSESGITIHSVEVSDAGQNFAFYIVLYEDISLNITSMISDEEHDVYAKEFGRIVDTISFEEIADKETTEEKTAEEETAEDDAAA